MKSIATLLLLGLIDINQAAKFYSDPSEEWMDTLAKNPEYRKITVGGVEMDLEDNSFVQFRPNPISSPWSAKPKASPSDTLTGAFSPIDDRWIESQNAFYSRKVPEEFSGAEDDLLMRSIIKKWALEGNDNGVPSGKFYVTRAIFDNISNDVVKQHLKYRGPHRQNFLKERCPKIWSHFDVNKKGYLSVNEVPQMLRMLLGEVELNNALQVQLAEEGAIVEEYRPDPVKAPWAAKSDPKKPGALDGAFAAWQDGINGYERKLPEHFSEGKDDLLMRSLISKYALEGQTAGKPNGNFYLNRKGFDEVAKEVVKTHLGRVGARNRKWRNERVPAIWKQFDNNGRGYLTVDEVPQALRMLLGEVELQYGLQVQLEEEGAIAGRPDPELQPWAAKPDERPKPYNKVLDGFGPHYESIHPEYVRGVPAQYADEKGDRLMHSLITKYGTEARGKDGKPTGEFYVMKSDGYAVAEEVVGTHLKLSGEKRKKYLDEHFNQLWNYYDVNGDGYLEVERVPTLLRSLVGEVETNFGLQMQLKSKQ